MLRILDETGEPLSASFEVTVDRSRLTCIMHSAGGKSRAAPFERNRDYAEALRVILQRLGAMDAVMTDLLLDSDQVRDRFSEDDRRIEFGYNLPLTLRRVDDFDRLRKAITRAQASMFRAEGAKSSGNGRKRIKMTISLPGDATPSVDQVKRELSALPTQEGSRQGKGQGRRPNAAERKAIEDAAMDAAFVHYKEDDWYTENVSQERIGYDIRCRRGDGEELHVEVKGTVGNAQSVILTAGEVAHAEAFPEQAALFVLFNVQIRGTGNDVVAFGGTPHWLDPWELDPQRLTPRTFTYALD